MIIAIKGRTKAGDQWCVGVAGRDMEIVIPESKRIAPNDATEIAEAIAKIAKSVKEKEDNQ